MSTLRHPAILVPLIIAALYAGGFFVGVLINYVMVLP